MISKSVTKSKVITMLFLNFLYLMDSVTPYMVTLWKRASKDIYILSTIQVRKELRYKDLSNPTMMQLESESLNER